MAITKTYICDRCNKMSDPRIDIFYMDNVEYKEATYPKDWTFVELDPPTVEKSVKVLLCDNCSNKFRDVMINFLLSKEEGYKLTEPYCSADMLSHKIAVKGNCTACGKTLGENDGLFLCADCQKKNNEEARLEEI